VKPLAQSGGTAPSIIASLPAYNYGGTGIKGRLASQEQGNEYDVDSRNDNTMEE